MEAIDRDGPDRFPFIVVLTKKAKIQGVKITVTAKLVIRGGWQNA